MKKPQKKDIIYLSVILLLVVALVTVSVLWAVGSRPKEESYYDKKCASFAVQNTNLTKGQIVFIGDSITDYFPLDGYFADLPQATYNRGIGGDTTSGVLARLKVSLYDLAPAKIVLLIGINDINGGVADEVILSNYRNILLSIKTNLPTAEVNCVSILPMNEVVTAYGVNLPTALRRIKALNEEIRIAAEGSGYRYVDLYSSVRDEREQLTEGFSDDGIHLNADGYAVWASVIKPFLQ